MIKSPENYGSTDRGTALIGNSDFDLSVLFKPEAYPTTSAMMDEVYERLIAAKHTLGNVRIRQQGKSIGIHIEDNTGTTQIDVVPCRITKRRGNKTSGYLNSQEKTLFGKNRSYTKTNIPLIKAQTLSLTQQKIVVALKRWKGNLGIKFKGALIEALVKDAYAYNRGNVPRAFADKIIMVWQHIADNLQTAILRSVENTNNILTRMPSSEKRRIIAACKSAIEDITYQPNSIIRAIKGNQR